MLAKLMTSIGYLFLAKKERRFEVVFSAALGRWGSGLGIEKGPVAMPRIRTLTTKKALMC